MFPVKPRWSIPRIQDQHWPTVHNRFRGSRPALVLVYYREADGSSTAHQMHTSDAERAIRDFPNQWSRSPNHGAPSPVDPPTPLEKLGALEREMQDLQVRLEATRREILG